MAPNDSSILRSLRQTPAQERHMAHRRAMADQHAENQWNAHRQGIFNALGTIFDALVKKTAPGVSD